MKVTWTAVGISKALQSKTRFPITHTKRWFRPTIYQFIHYRRYVLGHHTHRTTRTKPFWVFSDTFYESFIVKERVPRHDFFLTSFGSEQPLGIFFRDTILWDESFTSLLYRASRVHSQQVFVIKRTQKKLRHVVYLVTSPDHRHKRQYNPKVKK